MSSEREEVLKKYTDYCSQNTHGVNNECLYEQLSNSTFEDLIYKTMVYKAFYSEDDKKEKLAEIAKDMTKHLKIYSHPCFDGSELFGLIFEAGTEIFKSDEIMYCVRKHLVDNHYLDTSVYHIKVNPKDLETSSIDCSDEISTQRTRAHIPFGNEECTTKQLNEFKYFENISRIVFLAEVKINDDQKKKELDKFNMYYPKLRKRIDLC